MDDWEVSLMLGFDVDSPQGSPPGAPLVDNLVSFLCGPEEQPRMSVREQSPPKQDYSPQTSEMKRSCHNRKGHLNQDRN